MSDGTIVAMATPPGEGGVAIVRLSGPSSARILEGLVLRPGPLPRDWQSHRLYHGRALLDEAGAADEVLAVLMRAPRSYTREDVAEVHCHGGRVLPGLIVEGCVRLGARLARPGEFTLRAFLNGRLDLSQAEAVLGLIRANSTAAVRVAAEGLAGSLSRRVREIRLDLLDWLARLEAEIDFGEELPGMGPDEVALRLDRARAAIRSLLEGADEGRIRSEGMLTVLAGEPNAGKSTLLNLLLGEERALVTPYPGTTRDRLEELAVLDGLCFRLVDTAGLRVSHEPVERLGMERTVEALRHAEIVVVVLDGSAGWPEVDLPGESRLVVVNKRDLGTRLGLEEVRRRYPTAEIVETCLLREAGVAPVREALARLGRRVSGAGAEGVHAVNRRQREAILRASSSIGALETAHSEGLPAECLCLDLREAVAALGEVTGEDVTDEVLDRIFSTFCLGK